MIDCTFELNAQPMSALICAHMSFPAFSGLGLVANRREYACAAGIGPIPPGTYYIFDRQSGGLLGALRDRVQGHDDWFALYAADGKIDDETFCDEVKRGNFRLHPKRGAGISQGCITVNSVVDYQQLRAFLIAQPKASVNGTALKAYGRVIVK